MPESFKIFLTTKFLLLPLSFIASTCLLWGIVLYRPVLEGQSKNLDVNFPTSLNDVKKLFTLLTFYYQDHWHFVVFLFACGYIYKQTFAIPGSALLNILGGAIFGCWPYGVIFCCALSAVGASNCYVLSKFAGKDLIKKKFPAQVEWLREKLLENESQLLLFLISLRLFPATPNWLINIVAPIVNIPLPLFFVSVLIGLFPYNFLCMKAGETLSEIESLDEVFTPKRLTFLLFLALVMFGLSQVAKRNKVKFK